MEVMNFNKVGRKRPMKIVLGGIILKQVFLLSKDEKEK